MDDILDQIKRVKKRRELWAAVLDYFLAHGIDKVSYHAAATPHHEAGIMTHGFPEDWVCQYIGENLVKVDPIPALAATQSRPFRWSEAASLSELTPENIAFLADLKANVDGDGLAFTVFGPRLRNAYVGLGFASRRALPDDKTILEFQTVAQMGHLRFCELSEVEEALPPRLSPREHETLEWAAKGKSNSAIAQILGISPHTVDTLMRRIYEKLGVADRTSASIKAIGSGLLQYHDAVHN
ncbi:MAG: LuxR family transcriptional regulator [Pseudomonadota bacterium]